MKASPLALATPLSRPVGAMVPVGALIPVGAMIDRPATATAGGETDRAARTDSDASDVEQSLRLALDRDPRDVAAHCALATLRREQGHLAEAIALCRRAVALAPEAGDVHAHLGTMLLAARKAQAALEPLERALEIDPGLMNARSDVAIALSSLNRYHDAIPHYHAAYRIEPSNNSARYLESLALLALGDFTNGWRKHEARWYAELGQTVRARFDRPSWLGEPDIQGRTILLHAEQGLGDTLQFIRYAPLVARMGARVVVLVPRSIAPLLFGLDGIHQVIAYGEDIPDFDRHCSLMSLPRAFRTELATIPARVPYLAANAERAAIWGERLGPGEGRRRVALAWSGSKAVWNRSTALARLAPLLDRADCEFHVAQTEIADTDRAAMPRWGNLIDHSHALTDFADTAALVSHMDLVISVDTVLAHLAGALARDVWTMLPFGADYRWMTLGTTSPWYPTMRLFRQASFDDWPSVITAVTRALDQA